MRSKIRPQNRLSIALLPVLPIVLLSTSAQAFNPDHLAQLLKTNQCANCDLSNAKLEKANLSGANLTGANLSNATLIGANLSNANLEAANLQGSSLTEAYLFRANLTGANFTNAGLQKANLRETTLVGTNLSGADLRSANLQGNNLGQAKFPSANLSEANLSYIKGFAGVNQRTSLAEPEFMGLVSTHLCFSATPKEDPVPPEFEGVGTTKNLSFFPESDIDYKVVQADFAGANLSGANLQGSTLMGTSFNKVDLSGANLRSACLISVNLSGAKLDKADLQDIRLVSTTLPAGIARPPVSPTNPSLSATQRKIVEGKMIIGTLTRAQQAYYLENDRFTTSIEDLGAGIKPEMNDYRYRLFVAPDRHPSAMQVGLPKLSDLPTYIGFVHIEKAPKGESMTIATLCISQKPATPMPLWSAIDYKNPKKGEPIACPKGFTKVNSGEDPNPPKP
jgi:uncharacterized protein YjbI with pentapeptide repeats